VAADKYRTWKLVRSGFADDHWVMLEAKDMLEYNQAMHAFWMRKVCKALDEKARYRYDDKYPLAQNVPKELVALFFSEKINDTLLVNEEHRRIQASRRSSLLR
jgi:hypothetical protein